MEHAPVVGLVLALVLGLVSLTLVACLPRGEVPDGLRWLPITLLLYNLWIAAFLIANYFQDRIAVQPRLDTRAGGAWALLVVGLGMAWLYAHVTQLRAFLGAEPSLRARRIVPPVAVGLVILFVSTATLSAWSGNSAFLRAVVLLGGAALFPGALVASVWFVSRARRLRDVDWRRRFSRLGLAYAVLFGALFVLSVLWTRLNAVSPGLPVALDTSLELLYNVVAIVWVGQLAGWMGSTRPAVETPTMPVTDDRRRMLTDAGITRREAEIVDLICLGRTNQEIADQLFISVSTVKDHNYVIFQKLGVRNRTELTRRVLAAPTPQPK